MTTQNFPPLRSSPLMFREFQKVQENRRKLSRLTRPVVRKLIGVPTWICHMRHHGMQQPGFGLTPAEAYKDWKRRQW